MYQYHETHGAASYAQRLHPKLIEKSHELGSEGTTQVQEVKRALKHYVQHCLFINIVYVGAGRSVLECMEP